MIVASRISRKELITETTLLSITLRLAGDVTILEISYMPLSAVSLYLTLPGTVTVLAGAD
jgi:hypothetical protein